MRTAEWAIGRNGLAGSMHAVCVNDEKCIRISIACNKEHASKGIGTPHAVGLYTGSTEILARPLRTSAAESQNTEYACSMAGKLAKRCRKTVYIHYDSGDIPVGELCDEAFLSAIKMIITSFNL
jgi:hypothetical protein